MAKKLSKKEEYLLNVQDLMDAIPLSTVAKFIKQFKADGVTYRSIRWAVDGYAVHSDTRDVYSIGPGDTANFEFILKVRDYNKFVEACEKRRAEVLEQIKVKQK